MKAEKEKTGFFRRLLTAFASNWGLKLLALALAVIVYHSLKKENGSLRNSFTKENDSLQESHDRQLFKFR